VIYAKSFLPEQKSAIPIMLMEENIVEDAKFICIMMVHSVLAEVWR
jgi:hypothetical protein